MNRYQQYKATDLLTIGDIPSHWRLSKLKYVIGINSGDGIKPDSIDLVGSVPVYGGNGIMGYAEQYNSEATDIIIGRVGAKCGNVRLVEGRKWISDNALVAYVMGQNDLRFISILLDALNLNTLANQNAQPLITGTLVKEKLAAIPPLEEQTAIANYLDEKTAQIDTLIEKKQKLIELLKEERKAIINEAVSGEGKNWAWKKLKYVARLKSGAGITSDDITPEGEYPVYGGNGLRGYCSEFTHEGEYVLIGRQGALCGNINYAKGKFFASEHAVVVDILDGSRTLWLGELLRNMNLNQYSIASAQPGLSVERIQNISIPVPSKEEQDYIVRLIQAETSRVDITVCSVQREIELLQEYKSALISEVVTGKVKVI